MVKLTKTLALGHDEPISISHEYGNLKSAQDDMKKEAEIIGNALTRQGHKIEIAKTDKTIAIKIPDLGIEDWKIE